MTTELTYAWWLEHGDMPSTQDAEAIIRRWYASDEAQRRALTVQDLRHIHWRLIFESDRFPTIEAATQGWYDHSPSPAPTIGMIGFDGGFTQHGDYLIPLGIHAGDLPMAFVEGREQETHDAFADMRDLGVAAGTQPVCRGWTSINWRFEHPFWAGRELDPSNPVHRQRLEEFWRIGSEDYGVMHHVALGDSVGVTRQEKDEYFRWLADVVRRHPDWFALIECQNEILGTSDSWEHDPREVERQLQIVRDVNPNHLYATSAAAGEGSELELDMWTPDWSPFTYAHNYRGNRWGDQVRHTFSLTYETAVRSHGWSGEPPGMNLRPYHNGQTGPGAWVSGMDYPEDWMDAPWRYGLYMAATAVYRQVPTFMCSHGVKLEGRFKDVPGWHQTAELIQALPKDIMAFDRLFHGGDRFAGERILAATDRVRVDHAQADDGRCVMVVYPNSEPVGIETLRVERDWKGVYYMPGITGPITLRTGQSFTPAVSDGILFIGRLT